MSIKKTEDGKYILTVKGQETTLTEEELYQKASLANGAEVRLQEASEREKAMSDALVRFDRDQDPEALEALLNYLPSDYISHEEKIARVQEFIQAQKPEPESQPEPKPQSKPKPQPKSEPKPPAEPAVDEEGEGMKKYIQALQEKGFKPEHIALLMEEARKGYVSSREAEREKNMLAELEKDEILGTILRRGGPRAEIVKGLAKERLEGRYRSGIEITPNVRKLIVDDVKRVAKEFGKGDEPTSPGLGPSSGLSSTSTQATERPKSKSITDGDYNDYFRDLAAHIAATSD